MKRTRPLHLSAVVAGAATLAAVAYAATTWPDLTTLQNYPNPSGNTCTVAGTPGATAAKKAENRLKNRFKLPPSFSPVKSRT
jgi:hypothetical protein